MMKKGLAGVALIALGAIVIWAYYMPLPGEKSGEAATVNPPAPQIENGSMREAGTKDNVVVHSSTHARQPSASQSEEQMLYERKFHRPGLIKFHTSGGG